MTDVITRPATLSLAERTAADGVRFILATFVDMNGKPCAKLVPIEALGELEAGALGFAGFAAGAIGQRPQDPDICVIPDPASYASLDFIKPGLAMVQCDPYVNGEPWPYAPRVILANVLASLAAKGLTAMVGAEIEYFLLARDPDGSIHPADTRDESGQPCYDARGVTRMYEHLATTSKAMNDLGWGNYANDHEDGNGQFEQNFTFADAMTTADRVITLRYIISMVAESQGMTATFMPKPFSNRSGNGMHLHLSLWNAEGDSLFPSDGDAHGLGLSPTAYSFIAGILDHAPALQAFIAPSVNSYKRSGARTTTSGATWSPRVADFGGNDRTHFIRVPDGNRIELRGGDGSANPYLAIAATLAAGSHGIARGANPGAPNPPGVPGAAATPLPPTLLHAVEALRGSELLAETFGPAITAYYADVKEEEFLTWHNTVTPWEIDRYLTAF